MAETNLSEAIRSALDLFGVESGKEKTNKIKDWIKENYPHLTDKVDDKNFSAAIGGLRKKARDAAGEKPEDEALFAHTDEQQKAMTAQPAATAQGAAAPAVDMTLFVRTVKELQALSQRVGGKENLRKLLELL